MPLTGRSDVVEQCVSDLADGRAVVLIGAAGMGKTAVLDAVAQHLADGPSPVWCIAGADGESAVALAPFAGLVSVLSLAALSALDLHSRVPRELVATQARLVVDDADRLDPSSRVLLEHVVRAGVPVVAAVVDADSLSKVTSADGDRGPWLPRFVGPLDPDSLVSIAAGSLGGEPSAEAVSALITRAAGSPRTLLDLVAVAAQGSSMTPAGVVLGPRIATEQAVAAWEHDRAGMTAEEVVAAERIAVAGALPIDALDDHVLTALRQQGLVSVGERVALSTQMLHDAVLDSMSEALCKRRCAEVVDLLGDAPATDDAVLAAVLAARAGRVIDAGQAIAAADQALREGKPAAALEITEAAGEVSPVLGPRLALVRGAALSASERLDEAQEEFARAITEDDEWAFRLCQELGLLHAVRRGRPSEAVDAVATALAGLRDPGHRTVIEGELVKWRLMAGVPGTTPDQLTHAASADLQVGMALIQAMVASLDGPPAAALEIVEAGRRALAAAARPARHAYELLALSGFLAQCFDGEVTAAEEAAKERRTRALVEADPAVGLWEYVSGELALHAGRLADADSFARRAVIHLTWRDFTGLRPAAVSLHAATAARLGHVHVAARAVASLPQEASGDVKVALHVARSQAERRRRARDYAEASRLLRDAGVRAVAESHRHLGVMAIDEAWMITPTAKLANVLEDHGDAGGLAELLVRRAQAFHRKDTDGLLAAATSLTAAGMPGRALHTEELAANVWETQGLLHEARKMRARHRATRAFGQVASWPDGEEEGALTAREREVAVLAAARVRSKEIAARLGVSVRTVDNHLGNVFRKMGIQGRDELGEALAAVDS